MQRALRALIDRSTAATRMYYGYDMRDQPVEIVNLRLAVTVERRSSAAGKPEVRARDGTKQALLEKREVWFPERGFVATPVYDRDRLPARLPASPARRSSSRWTRRRSCRRARGCATTGAAICTWRSSRCPLQAQSKRLQRQSARPRRVDPIKAEVVARFLLATAEEMGATLMRTAFSPNIKERADCSTAIFDRARRR